jgi:hypothetical protein
VTVIGGTSASASKLAASGLAGYAYEAAAKHPLPGSHKFSYLRRTIRSSPRW